MKTISPYAQRNNDLLLTTASAGSRQYVLKFRDLPDADKPREKLLATDPSKLSTKELLAIVDAKRADAGDDALLPFP